MTSKGKTLQLIITTDDPSESDIEEIKCILNKAYEENFEDKKKYVEKKDLETNTQKIQNKKKRITNTEKHKSRIK